MGAAVGIIYTAARWEEKELVKRIADRGARARLIHVEDEPLEIGGRLKEPVDIAIQRSMLRPAAPVSSAVLESQGVRVVNTSISTLLAQDKGLSLSILSSRGIKIPRTFLTLGLGAALKAGSLIGYPLVFKPTQGSWGRLVSLVSDEEMLRSLEEHREAMQDPRSRIGLVQEYVEKGNKDLRILVVGSRVAGAMYRVGGFVTNYARGSEVVKADLEPEAEDLALRTSQALGLEIAGIDVFETKDRGYLVNEANPVPEFKGLSAATGTDVAGEIVEYVLSLIRR